METPCVGLARSQTTSSKGSQQCFVKITPWQQAKQLHP